MGKMKWNKFLNIVKHISLRIFDMGFRFRWPKTFRIQAGSNRKSPNPYFMQTTSKAPHTLFLLFRIHNSFFFLQLKKKFAFQAIIQQNNVYKSVEISNTHRHKKWKHNLKEQQ